MLIVNVCILILVFLGPWCMFRSAISSSRNAYPWVEVVTWTVGVTNSSILHHVLCNYK